MSVSSVQFRSVTQSCPTLCDPMNRSTPGLPVRHQLPEFTQTHVHRVSDAICRPLLLLPPIPPSILAVQGTLKSLLQHHSSKASIPMSGILNSKSDFAAPGNNGQCVESFWSSFVSLSSLFCSTDKSIYSWASTTLS